MTSLERMQDRLLKRLPIRASEVVCSFSRRVITRISSGTESDFHHTAAFVFLKSKLRGGVRRLEIQVGGHQQNQSRRVHGKFPDGAGSGVPHAFTIPRTVSNCAGKERIDSMNKSLIWASILGITALVAIPGMAENATSKGVKTQASAHDANVNSDNMTNMAGHAVAPPVKSRGLNGTCDIRVSNQTGLYVQFFFNGNPAGTIGPWGALTPNITEGNASLYARAVFTDGSVLTFGPRALTCTGGDFTWTLTP